MKLLRYRVTNFRSVDDSGWIDVDDVTAFVGVNESGKTNLLLPLWKLNPAKEGGIEPTADFPKNNYGAIRANPTGYRFVQAEFDLQEFAKEFSSLTGYSPEQVRRLHIWKNYGDGFIWSFPDAAPPKSIDSSPIVKELVSLSAGIKEAKELAAESGLKEKCLTTIDHIKSGIKDRVTSAEFENLYQEIFNLYNDSHAKTSAIHPRLAQANAEFENVYNIFNRPAPTAVEGAWEAIKPRLPVFLYYSNYGNLDSEIYLPHVVDNLTRTGLGAKEAAKARTLKVLFSFVGLDPKEILELGRDFKDPADPNRKPTEAEIEAINKKKKERSILLQSAGTKLTSKFKDWWKQGDYRFRFEADGDHFRIWVSDDRRPEEVELEGRSTGLQWFLSFYLVFLVESEGEHKDAFLLLDEPGLSLHPLAQKNLSSFFVNLATTNQIIFTTHSPFLVDADNLDQARKVYVSENGSTKATGNLNEGESRKSQPGASYALSSALNLHVAESLLIGCEPVIVEGPSDQYILSAIKTLLIGAGRIAPPKELVFPPSGGAKSVKVISSILLGRDDQLPIVLLDDDTVGRSAAKELKQELYKGVEKRILNIAEYVGFEGAEIEDIVPPDLFVAVVDREIRLENSFEDVHKASSPIVPQIEKWAASSGHTLEKGWKVPLAIAVKRKLLSQEIKKLDGKQVDDWGRLFDDFFERKQD